MSDQEPKTKKKKKDQHSTMVTGIILLGIGVLAAVLRGTVGKNWRLLHYVNYVAFWLATVHGILIGSNVQSWVMRGVFILLALIVLGVLLHKRLGLPRLKRA